MTRPSGTITTAEIQALVASADLAAAWDLIAQLTPLGYRFHILQYERGDWSVAGHYRDPVTREWAYEKHVGPGDADAVPALICRAALLISACVDASAL